MVWQCFPSISKYKNRFLQRNSRMILHVTSLQLTHGFTSRRFIPKCPRISQHSAHEVTTLHIVCRRHHTPHPTLECLRKHAALSVRSTIILHLHIHSKVQAYLSVSPAPSGVRIASVRSGSHASLNLSSCCIVSRVLLPPHKHRSVRPVNARHVRSACRASA